MLFLGWSRELTVQAGPPAWVTGIWPLKLLSLLPRFYISRALKSGARNGKQARALQPQHTTGLNLPIHFNDRPRHDAFSTSRLYLSFFILNSSTSSLGFTMQPKFFSNMFIFNPYWFPTWIAGTQVCEPPSVVSHNHTLGGGWMRWRGVSYVLHYKMPAFHAAP